MLLRNVMMEIRIMVTDATAIARLKVISFVLDSIYALLLQVHNVVMDSLNLIKENNVMMEILMMEMGALQHA